MRLAGLNAEDVVRRFGGRFQIARFPHFTSFPDIRKSSHPVLPGRSPARAGCQQQGIVTRNGLLRDTWHKADNWVQTWRQLHGRGFGPTKSATLLMRDRSLYPMVTRNRQRTASCHQDPFSASRFPDTDPDEG